MAHWVALVHGTHEPPLHARLPHAVHAPPFAPQALGKVPGTQCVPSQHPPLHCKPPVQIGEQVPLLQARSGGQSVTCRQPHPPSTHCTPLRLFEQSTHGPPEPHALADGITQELPVQQRPASQVVVHWAVHMPFTHCEVLPLQDTQGPPVDPQTMLSSPGRHVSPESSQQPPLHGELALHRLVHVCVIGSQASF